MVIFLSFVNFVYGFIFFAHQNKPRKWSIFFFTNSAFPTTTPYTIQLFWKKSHISHFIVTTTIVVFLVLQHTLLVYRSGCCKKKVLLLPSILSFLWLLSVLLVLLALFSSVYPFLASIYFCFNSPLKIEARTKTTPLLLLFRSFSSPFQLFFRIHDTFYETWLGKAQAAATLLEDKKQGGMLFDSLRE